MISVMNNNDLELDWKLRASDDAVFDSSSGAINGDIKGVEEIRASLGDDVDSSDKVRVSVDKGAEHSEEVSVLDGGINLDNAKVVDARVSGMGTDDKMEIRVNEIQKNNQLGVQNGAIMQLGSRVSSGEDTESTPKGAGSKVTHQNRKMKKVGSKAGKGHAEAGKSTITQYDKILPMFDEFAGNGRDGALPDEPTKLLGNGYEIGDMVWGKVKSHPWWPGHIYSEAITSPLVRGSKRPGHVLVAFFGDSSYGWFDPAELIPFDSNFSERSRQTSSRTFVKAVEEAVDEVSRRRALGLACRCRNPYNFRPTSVEGYIAVDVGDYEPGMVYSINQIRKSRDSFQPRETLAFIKDLALSPTSNSHGDIHFIKSKATVLAYRKAIFEEFDETYAQAFGYQPERPSPGQRQDAGQLVRAPSRAPLSGPLVIAEALGKGKGSAKANKSKDQAKKDRYLFKRRNEPNELKSSSGPATASQPVCVEGSLAVADNDYVLQKRSPLVSTKRQVSEIHERSETIARDNASALSPDETAKGVTKEERRANGEFGIAGSQIHESNVESHAPSGQAPGQISSVFDAKFSPDRGNDVGVEADEGLGSDLAIGHTNRNASESVGDMHQTFEPTVFTVHLKETHPSSSLSQLAKVESHGEQARDGSAPAKIHEEGSSMHTDTRAKKAKLSKRPLGELGSDNSIPLEKKKKRKKEHVSSQNQIMHPSGGKGGSSVKVPGKSALVALESKEDFHVDLQKKDEKVSALSSPGSIGTHQTTGNENIELELPQLLHDLRALALNPFHLFVRSPAVVRQVFIRFRSLVYQKSLASLPPADGKSNDSHASKIPVVATANEAPAENVRELQSNKQQKPVMRPADPTKSGRKRGPSDRQEEIAAKKKKKLSDMKQLTSEKKAAQKPQVPQRGETSAPTPKPVKPESIKKAEPPSEPAMLQMKFPPTATLPSLNELKARFARFGQLDHSATRVFWNTLTCRVVYRHKVDAETAYRYAVSSHNLFGSRGVRCSIRDVAAPESESVKAQREGPSTGAQQWRDSAVEQRTAGAQHPGVHLKSILKKSTGDEAGASNGGGRGTPRVKFMLGGEETSKVGEQLMIGNKNNNFNNNASFADGGASSSSSLHGMDFNSKNFQKVIPPSPLPLLPLPTTSTSSSTTSSTSATAVQFPRPPNNLQYTEAAPRNNQNFNIPIAPPPPPPSTPNVDISQQMLSLLTKCNDVVNNVTGLLGYVPYHPL